MANARKSCHFLVSTLARPGIPEKSFEKTAEEAAALKRKIRHSCEVFKMKELNKFIFLKPLVIVQPLPTPRKYKNFVPPDDIECFGPFRRKESGKG